MRRIPRRGRDAHSRTLRVAVIVAFAIAIGVGALAVWHGRRAPTLDAAASRPDDGARIVWPEGRRQVYRLRYASHDEARPMVDDALAGTDSPPVSSRLELDATLAVTGLGPGDEAGSSRLRFEVLSCERARWEVAGAAVWPDARACESTLRSASLGAQIDVHGTPTAVFDPEGAVSSTQSFLQTLWLHMQASLPTEPVEDGGRYWAQERTLQGLAGNVYVLLRDGKHGYTLNRTTHAVLDLRVARGLRRPPDVDAGGTATFEIDGSGRLQRALGDERLDVSTESGLALLRSQTSFGFEWLREEPAGALANLDTQRRRAPASILASEALREKMLENRIDGLDVPTLVETLRSGRARVDGREQARFMWQATGLLEQHPEASRELLALYRRPETTQEQQARILDLLVSAGHHEAQVAMREALADPQHLDDDVGARHLYQRLGLLERPEPETAALVAAHYHDFQARGSLDAEITAAYSLGAIVAGLAEGDGESRALAERYNDMLVHDLEAATDSGVRAHRVAALGNTRLEENVPALSALADDDDDVVRERVAQALGRVAADAPPPALVALIDDPDPVVQRSAVRAAPPAEEVYDRLLQRASSAALPELTVRPVLDLVKQGRQAHRETTDRLLDAMLDQGITDDQNRELAYRLRRM